MSVADCWFCAAPAHPIDSLRAYLHRDVEFSTIIIITETRWKQTWVDVPRCRRCWVGHRIEQAIFYVLAASAGLTGFSLFVITLNLLGGERIADVWLMAIPVLWTLGWLALWSGVRRHRFTWEWLAPRPQRYAREYPPVKELLEDGWKYRPGP